MLEKGRKLENSPFLRYALVDPVELMFAITAVLVRLCIETPAVGCPGGVTLSLVPSERRTAVLPFERSSAVSSSLPG